MNFPPIPFTANKKRPDLMSDRFLLSFFRLSGAAAAAALDHLHTADRFMLPTVHAFEEVRVALPVAVVLAGFASHQNSSPFLFWQQSTA